MITIYVHPTCYSSYHLVKELKGKSLRGLEFKVLRSPQLSLTRGIVSVPWVEVGGSPAATDPVSAEEVEQMASGKYAPSVGKPEEAFMKALLSSSFSAALSLLHGDIVPAISRAFVMAALRTPFSGLDEREIMEDLLRSSRALYENAEQKIAKTVSMAYVRELYWAGAREARADKVAFYSWLLAKASIGRAGLPIDPRERNERGIGLVLSIIEGEGERLMERVAREQSTIYGDREYLEYVKSLDQV
ncbi:MAG: hypothetical protein NZ902_04425 [Acidilobaceae archaeon]|nr:hypothetical protein [Acidilobaceae archaeon]MCX8165024.1 hypothetical protein [Acidilobaceae archaeon]MDW7974459.1 hypothetical protein [Sulfolobales archaeon]